MNEKPRIFTTSFGSVYPLYVQKAERKGRTREEVDQIISWLTGYSGEQLQRAIDAKVALETTRCSSGTRTSTPGPPSTRAPSAPA